MALLVWFTMGIAIWHFTVFVPDRFFGGMIGALGGAIAGSIFVGFVIQLVEGKGIDDASFATVAVAVPGAVIGLFIIYQIGARRDREHAVQGLSR